MVYVLSLQSGFGGDGDDGGDGGDYNDNKNQIWEDVPDRKSVV